MSRSLQSEAKKEQEGATFSFHSQLSIHAHIKNMIEIGRSGYDGIQQYSSGRRSG